MKAKESQRRTSREQTQLEEEYLEGERVQKGGTGSRKNLS